MFTTIRKHQTWLWAFIIAAVIVSFVIYFTPTSSQGGGGERRSQFGSIHGRPISRDAFLQAYVESRLGFLLRFGVWPDQSEARRAGADLDRDTRNRIVLLDQLRALNIQVGSTAIAEWILENFGGDQPASAKAKYDSFVRELRQRHGVTEADFQRFIEHEIGLAHLATLAGTAGKLVTPREAAALYRTEHEQVEAQAAVFSLSNHLASVTLDPAELAQFYTNRQSTYRIPERVQLHYLKFPTTNYLAQAEQALARNTNLMAEIDRQYLSSNPGTFTDTNGQIMPPELAKARIRQQRLDQQAIAEAHKHAARFATNLEPLKPATTEAFLQLATSNSLPTFTTEPFAETTGPIGLRIRRNFIDLAFKLTPELPVALSPLRGEDAVYLIALKQRLPSEVPPLTELQARVEREFKQDAALRLAREAGTNFVQQLTNALAQGKTFESATTEAGVTLVTLPKFSTASRSLPDWDRRVDLNLARTAAANLSAGTNSPFLSTRDGGFVLQVKSRIPVPDADLTRELPEFMASLRQSKEYEAFNDWFRQQVEVSRIQTIGSDSE